MWKHIVVLANSVKHEPGRCIAGREVFPSSGGVDFGPWIRPVSRIGEGELYPRHFTFEDGSVPHIFDMIEIHIDAPDTDKTQPENWFVSDKHPWKRSDLRIDGVGYFEYFGHDDLVESPRSLWLQPGVKTDRVTKEFLAANPPSQSLYLIELHNATISGSKKKHRLRFSLNGTTYDVAITDPLINSIAGAEPTTVIAKGLACISLAPAFPNQYDGKEYHYKLAAMVISYD